MRDLDQRHADLPGAALFNPAGQRHQRAQRAEVARDVVEGLDRQVAWLLQGALRRGEAGHVLDDRVEAAPRRPRAFVAIGAEADADDARPQRRHLLGREAARGQRAGTIPLGEDVGVLQKRLHRLDARRLAQVDPGAALAVAGVHQQFGLIGQVRRRDVQYVGAVLRQHAAARGAGQHAREIEGANARQWPVALGQRLGRRVADLHDVDQRQLGDGDAVRMGVPLLAAARQAADAATVGNRLFDREPVPLGDGGG